ncbi:glycogen/starch/alpha-glucan phosphorylase [Rhodoplanes sp. Z2-YC6860]|uniref:glycogen/starch/alpha-glucan phosphorylase n=1 Tax=Rhodoplanes sp. Z2-YC6860 TaxID=674703 RepID=UPI00078C38F4|nr:glycogen/starch/alpha-glucan phosphorylase [Rhodoplanes sp. Z2-YC6860]AMN43942.1 glycogen/starch/alpha-glucan phosphorylase [Rhodoplanes sp. Z2-YC6860]
MPKPSNVLSHPAESADIAAFRAAVLDKLAYSFGKTPDVASLNDWYMATALALRDRIVARWLKTGQRPDAEGRKRVYYLSIEYLLGQLLFDALINMRLLNVARAALADLDVDIDQLRKLEPDAALGNGGLGRLAACYMDSMAALAVPAYGYGIRYENGLFVQQIRDGWQNELPERWLSLGNPWEFERTDTEYSICFGGSVEYVGDGHGNGTARGLWYPDERVLAVAYDTPIAGWRGRHVNTLRLWSARATTPVQLAAFNEGDLVGATAPRAQVEAISRVLYPSDATAAGQELRLRQEYFFTSASLQDITRRHLEQHGDLTSLPDHAAIQLNDTHPAIAVAELMRILVDEHEHAWDEAWRITKGTLSYTNHTLLPEALESWPVPLLNRLLPRHMQIIYLINKAHLDDASAKGFVEPGMLASISLIQEGHEKRVRMGHLAFVGSHRINGVSALHTDLMQKTVFRDLNRAAPGRIVNVTNGITFRRWLYEANPSLTALLVNTLGERVLDDPAELLRLKGFCDDAGFVEEYKAQRRRNKQALAGRIHQLTGVRVDPTALFDVQIKRIHEYKRQLLNILEAVAVYLAIRREPERSWVPRVKLFAGKAAASYERAKLIIKLAGDVGQVINNDPLVGDKLKVVFMPNYSVSLAQCIIPGSDLSEQISTAGMEASGTGNMKLALNGALTIGTLDGANIEIRNEVGADNIFIFGLTAEEIDDRRRAHFTGRQAASPRLMEAIKSIDDGVFSPDQPDRFKPIAQALLGYDHFMVAADFDAYWDAQRKVDLAFVQPGWWRSSILNTSRMGWFSSDRAIREYASEIWSVPVVES